MLEKLLATIQAIDVDTELNTMKVLRDEWTQESLAQLLDMWNWYKALYIQIREIKDWYDYEFQKHVDANLLLKDEKGKKIYSYESHCTSAMRQLHRELADEIHALDKARGKVDKIATLAQENYRFGMHASRWNLVQDTTVANHDKVPNQWNNTDLPF